jgi:hypothetical protein
VELHQIEQRLKGMDQSKRSAKTVPKTNSKDQKYRSYREHSNSVKSDQKQNPSEGVKKYESKPRNFKPQESGTTTEKNQWRKSARNNELNEFAANNHSDLPEASNEVKLFWEGLVKKKFDIHNPNHLQLWMQCWIASAAGTRGNSSILMRTLLSLPASRKVLPPSSHVLETMLRFVKRISPIEAGSGPNQQINNAFHHSNFIQSRQSGSFEDLEAIITILKERLSEVVTQVPDAELILTLMDDLKTSYTLAVASSITKNPQDVTKLSSLYMKLHEFDRYKEALERRAEVLNTIKGSMNGEAFEGTDVVGTIEPWMGWLRSPSLGWLMSGHWLIVHDLQSVYATSDDYVKTLTRLWTLLTFYWGAAAVWPHCMHRQTNGPGNEDIQLCGEPLLEAATNHQTCTCMRSGGNHGGNQFCGKPAVWKCHRPYHDAVCARCLQRRQEGLIGPPGIAASTDIYDGVIDRETSRREGMVYLISQLQSRKPPKIAPNWQTSYRLQVSCLVGIIKLTVSRERLTREMPITWCEIIPIDHRESNDSRARALGRVAVRPLSRTDCPILTTMEGETTLDVGTRVAIIDLRAFVPEVVSILSTFAQPSFRNHLAQIPFIDRLIGHEQQQQGDKDDHNDHLTGVGMNDHLRLPNYMTTDIPQSTHKMIFEAIEKSEIEQLRHLSEKQRKLVALDICRLSQVRSLYGTQLEAFTAGLASAVHCTQGPPGTGNHTTL